jgi:hypothetical protein
MTASPPPPRRNNQKITLRMQTALKAKGHTYDDQVLVSGTCVIR